jgi:hypothetical protein
MSLDSGWVIADGRGRFLADDGWVADALQASVFREMWAAEERARAASGLILPWATAVQVGAFDAAAPAA